ncbi:MAG: restriction endonuclease subunit S [Anaerolineales bacterium]
MSESVPKGYKRTEVGVIPEEWEVTPLEKIAKVKGGKRLPKGFTLVSSPNSHPYIRVSDMFMGGVNTDNLLYVPDEAYHYIQDYRIYLDDIFISVAGSLGIVGKIPQELNGANLTENADRITEISCDRDYLLYWLSSKVIQKLIQSNMTVGAQPKLAIKRIQEFPIVLPPFIEEQRAIAEVLSDVDSLLAALDRLIAKKRAVKQAAMLDLLTGRVRLPGFEGAWRRKELRDIANIFKGQGLSKSKVFKNGQYPCILYGELFTTYQRVIKEIYSYTDLQEGILSQCGDILIPGSTTTNGNDLSIAFALLVENVLIGGDINIIRLTSDEFDSVFLAYYLTHIKRKEIAERSQGITIIHLYGKDLNDLEIDVPSFREQTAIAAVLSDLDAEITALERERAKWQDIKQGMMNDLLTGKVRLVQNQESGG